MISYGNWKHILSVFKLWKQSYDDIFVIKPTYMRPTVSAKSHQCVFWWLSSTALFTLHTTKSQLHFHTTTSPSLPLPCPHLLLHYFTDWSSADLHHWVTITQLGMRHCTDLPLTSFSVWVTNMKGILYIWRKFSPAMSSEPSNLIQAVAAIAQIGEGRHVQRDNLKTQEHFFKVLETPN